MFSLRIVASGIQDAIIVSYSLLFIDSNSLGVSFSHLTDFPGFPVLRFTQIRNNVLYGYNMSMLDPYKYIYSLIKNLYPCIAYINLQVDVI